MSGGERRATQAPPLAQPLGFAKTIIAALESNAGEHGAENALRATAALIGAALRFALNAGAPAKTMSLLDDAETQLRRTIERETGAPGGWAN